MQSRELIDFAVMLAERSDVITRLSRRLEETSLQKYWISARSLINEWSMEIRRFQDQMEEVEYGSDVLWLRWAPLFEEILISEMTTRLWACLLDGCDRRLGLQEYAPIGRSTLSAHLDLRRRLLASLLRGRQRAAYPVWRLNRTRQSVERWTDLLLAATNTACEIGPYTFDPARHAGRQAAAQADPQGRCAVLRAASQTELYFASDVAAARENLHRQCQAAILGCWGPELFLATGPIMASWQARLLASVDDAHGWLNDWAGWRDPDPDETTLERPMRRSSRFY